MRKRVKEGGEGKTAKGHEELLRRDEYVHSFDLSDSFMSVYIFLNLSNCTL